MESSGKTLRDALTIFGTADLSAFWPDDGEWYDARPIAIKREDKDSRQKTPEDLVATHFRYILPGVYCPVEYEDGVRHLIPVSYIYQRGDQPQPIDHQKGDPTGSAATTSFPTKEGVNNMVESLRDISRRASLFGPGFAEAARRVEEAAAALDGAFARQAKEATASTGNRDGSKGAGAGENVDAAQSSATTAVADAHVAPPRASTKPCYDLYWRELPEHVKIVARRIGYDKKRWDNDGRIPLDLKKWRHMTLRERQDLTAIDYDESTWDAKGEASSSDSDEDY